MDAFKKSSKLFNKYSLKASTPEDISSLRASAIPLTKLCENEYQLIREAVGNARVVLLGEASHGTQEFYQHRAEITKALIKHSGFKLVTCEGR